MNIITNWNAHNSSLEGAMKLKFAPFCSSSNALSNGMIFSKRRDACLSVEACLVECCLQRRVPGRLLERDPFQCCVEWRWL